MSDQVPDSIDLDRSSGATSCGIHLFEITGFKSQVSGSGNPTWIFDVVCIDPASEDKGIKMSLFLTMTQAARWKVDEFLDAVGAPRKGRMSGAQFMHKTFRGNVEDSEWDNKITRKITQCLPPTGAIGASAQVSKDGAQQPALPAQDFETRKSPF